MVMCNEAGSFFLYFLSFALLAVGQILMINDFEGREEGGGGGEGEGG